VVAFASLAQAENGYGYQAPVLSLQQQLPQIGQSNNFNAQQSVSHSAIQNNFISTSNGQHLLNNHHNYYYNGFGNNVHGSVPNIQPQSPVNIPPPPVQAIVTKHIYFHVPPPDIEDRPVQRPVTANRKKSYNIVFIKVPSQEVPRNLYAAVEDRTLIYVLVKKPADESQVLRKPSPPNHEVFYVKYKGNTNNVVSQISSGGVPQQNFGPSLRPGLINGQ
ncbi:uncharacterized protein LOC114356407, partial [Ostrinia furnacalis]|uniref:uncharacterized protein LOC114356407 n=1 Tax=Ostrinia furnacalis TaxID=93504 RepID=UPI00104051F6